MSAAARAAKRGESHILLERMSHLTDTVFGYQQRKHVMAVPPLLPLRSDLRFEEGAREEILELWTADVAAARVNVRLNAEVRAVRGERGQFAIELAGGETVGAAHVVLAAGTNGSPRKLGVPGAERDFVHYDLRHAGVADGMRVVVIGAGDSALEDALSLMERNEVVLVNRGTGFPKAKPANVARLGAAVRDGRVRVCCNAVPARIDEDAILLATDEGEIRVPCERIVARLGTATPGDFLRACGLAVPEGGFPPVSETYESQVPGLYVIGAIAGYPLIKHGLKQGYEVVEHILGNHLVPADEPLLAERLRQAAIFASVAEFVAHLRKRIPLFAPLPVRLIREFLLHAALRRARPGEAIYRRGDYFDRLQWIVDGEVAIEPADPACDRVLCRAGDVVGAREFASGRPRTDSATALRPSLLIEADGAAMAVLFRAAPSLRHAVDRVAMAREIALHLVPGMDEAGVAALVSSARLLRFKRGEALVEEGASHDPLYLIRKGSVALSRRAGGRETIMAYLSTGHFIGEALYLAEVPPPTVRAISATEAIRIDRQALRAMLEAAPEQKRLLARAVRAHLDGPLPDRRQSDRVAFLLGAGLGEATDVLLIDDALCIGCNNCESACAETHGGVAAFDREAGPRHGSLHVTNGCRHCEQPHCMTDCPTNALHRAPDGSIYIDDSCTGCGFCERNCPYGAIRVVAEPGRRRNLLASLLFGWGDGARGAKDDARKHAVKCDACRGAEAPACVAACPTGAAIRIDPEPYIQAQLKRRENS